MTWPDVHRLFTGGLLAGLAVVAPPVVGKALAGGVRGLGWWSFTGLVAVCAVVAMLVVALVRRSGSLSAARALLAVVTGLLLTYPLAGADMPDPWVRHLVPAAAAAGGVGLPLRGVAWGTSALVGAQAWAQTAPGWTGTDASRLLDAVTVVAVAAAATLPAVALRAWAARVEAARNAALVAAARESAALAAEREKARWDALIHDDLIAALTEGTRVSTESEMVSARRAAQHALDRLRQRPVPAPVGPRDFAESLRARVLHACPDAVLAVRVTSDAAPVPPDVADAVIDAAVEAVRNCRRHAWPAGGREQDERLEVLVTLTETSVEVSVDDNGVGFDTGSTPEGRWGLELSVRRRLLAVGGSAEVRSAPGEGTRVVLRHPVPDLPHDPAYR